MSAIAEVVETLSRDEARRLTDEAKNDARVLWRTMARLYSGGAHGALGYTSWKEYCQEEFGMAPKVGYQLLDAGRVIDAIETCSSVEQQVPSQVVARHLATLLPSNHEHSRRAGSNQQVAEAWAEVVEESEKADAPITAAFTKRVLIAKGYLPDTGSGGAGKPGWFELLGSVGDGLDVAGRHLDKLEAELGAALDRKNPKSPNEKFIAKAHAYAETGAALVDRLRAIS